MDKAITSDKPKQFDSNRKQVFKSYEAKSLRSRTFLNKVADDLTVLSGTPAFLVWHVLFFSGWIIVNSGYLPYIHVLDPFPYSFLTMLVSLEAIFLSIFVLISQNRSAYISTLRDEVHLRVNTIAEQEITKILSLMYEMRSKMGIRKNDPELQHMMEQIDHTNIERAVSSQLERANKSLLEQFRREFPDLFRRKHTDKPMTPPAAHTVTAPVSFSKP